MNNTEKAHGNSIKITVYCGGEQATRLSDFRDY